MKEPIEELFKQSLEGHQLPYNPDAWAAMNARLDAIRPVVAPRSYLPYYIAAAGIGVVAITSYFVFTAGTPEMNASTAATIKQKENTTTQTNKPTTGNQAEPKGNASVISNQSKTNSTTDKRSQNTGTAKSPSNPWTNNIGSQNNGTGGQKSTNFDPKNYFSDQGSGEGSLGRPSVNNGNPSDIGSIQKMIIPTLSSACLNEEVVINNTNGRTIYVFDALNRIVAEIPGKKSTTFKPTVVGTYGIGYTVGSEQVVATHFTVNRIPNADFSIDLFNKFEDGLPATHVEAISGQGTYTWKAGRQTANGEEADLHFYKKGSQTIELTVSDGNCSASTEKTIQVEEDYNLMAVNSFTPTSDRRENQTFMPYALTQRNVNFRMVILDGIDGGVVYETTDASLPWDGTDMRSGARNSNQKAYVWKVVIYNPAANEPNEYRGTVIKN